MADDHEHASHWSSSNVFDGGCKMFSKKEKVLFETQAV